MKLCTKLTQWMTLAGVFFSVWTALIADALPIKVSKEAHQVILILPLYLLICFGCYSLATIGYRLVTFNDCEEASAELMEEVRQAREDLTKKGMTFSKN